MSEPINEIFASSSSLAITRDSEEWGSVEAFLQVTYRTGNVSLRGLWSISNPSMMAKFERRSKGLSAVAPTVLSAADISEELSLGTICEKGFPDELSGIRVNIGNLPLPSGFMDCGVDRVRRQGRGRRVFETLILKVVVGKSYIVDAPISSDETLMEDIGKDYDSVLIRQPDSENEQYPLKVSSASPNVVTKGFLPPHAFCQTYILRDSSQLLPLFVCRFEIDTDKDEPLSLAPCQSCEGNAATVWCAADAAALCPECDESHHSVNHLTQRHIRVPINERPRPPGPCSVKPDRQAELWNEALGLAVSTEAQKEHFLTTVFEDIKDAYKSSVRVARREDEELEAFKAALISRIKAQEEAMASLDRMVKDAEENCYRRVGDILKKTLTLTEQRTGALIAEERKLQTKIEFAHWAEDLLRPYAHVVPPAEWLSLWLTHYQLTRKQLLGSQPAEDLGKTERELIETEIRLKGHLQVKDIEKVVPPFKSS